MYDKTCLPADHPMRKSVVHHQSSRRGYLHHAHHGLPSMLDTLALQLQ